MDCTCTSYKSSTGNSIRVHGSASNTNNNRMGGTIGIQLGTCVLDFVAYPWLCLVHMAWLRCAWLLFRFFFTFLLSFLLSFPFPTSCLALAWPGFTRLSLASLGSARLGFTRPSLLGFLAQQSPSVAEVQFHPAYPWLSLYFARWGFHWGLRIAQYKGSASLRFRRPCVATP